MAVRQTTPENPSRRKLLQPRISQRTLVRQDISRRSGLQANLLSDATLMPPFAVRVLTRMGFGLRRKALAPESTPDPDRIFTNRFERSDLLGSDDVAYFLSLGQSDDQRLENYVDEQLSDELPDPEWEARKAAYPAARPAFRVNTGGAGQGHGADMERWGTQQDQRAEWPHESETGIRIV